MGVNATEMDIREEEGNTPELVHLNSVEALPFGLHQTKG
jgi:hypothetical protein